MQKSQSLTIAIFIVGISILNFLVGAHWGSFEANSLNALEIQNSETIQKRIVESIFEEKEQMLDSTTPTTKNQARLAFELLFSTKTNTD